jgi:CheY-like chemotaxis protein
MLKEYECVKADSGRHALKILLTNYDLPPVMDVRANLDGYETAIDYERENWHIPIIFITAYSVVGHIFKGYKTGPVVISTSDQC